MPDLLGAANAVPGYDRSVTNRGAPVSTENSAQLQNIVDPDRIGRADGRTERDDNDLQKGDQLRYSSNYSTFLQRLEETPGMAESMMMVFSGMGTRVLSGVQEGVASEMAQIMEMLQMDEAQLLDFLKGQSKIGTRFGGPLFDLLRTAYAKSGSQSVQTAILQFLKHYSDHASTPHLENSMQQELRRMADAMPARWGDQLREQLPQLAQNMENGERGSVMKQLAQDIFPFMGRYVSQTHDMGLPRQLLSMLALDAARYENGSLERVLDSFHVLRGFSQLGLEGINDQLLLTLLEKSSTPVSSTALRFSDKLADAAGRALRGDGSMEVQQGFKNLVSAMLINESVYMPVNHYLLPMEMDGRMLFSELWVDPDAEERMAGGEGNVQRFLLKVDVQELGLFDVVLTSRRQSVDVHIACPGKAAPFSKDIESAVTEILQRNGLTPGRVQAREMEEPLALTDVFPSLFNGRSGINVHA